MTGRDKSISHRKAVKYIYSTPRATPEHRVYPTSRTEVDEHRMAEAERKRARRRARNRRNQ